MSLKAFKVTDETEANVRDAFDGVLAPLGEERDVFYEEAFECYVLGDVLFALKADPLAGAIPLEFYRTALPAIHSLLAWPGTFEFYLSVFRKIWGDDVGVEFTVPAPGKLLINIAAATVELQTALFRRIEDDAYVFDEWVDHEGDSIMFQGIQGIKTQDDVDTLMRELRVAGVWVQTALVIS